MTVDDERLRRSVRSLKTVGRLPVSGEKSEIHAIHILNAGVVLAAPYLPRFFEMSRLLETGRFRDDRAVEKGIRLLSYLARGDEEFFEPFLVLDKILCGLPLDRRVGGGQPLMPEEKQMADDLIRGMIQNWPVLKKTSVEGFRDSFLLRRGVLSLKEDVWTLKVEKRSFDMLLDQLPWSYQTIKYSWMDTRVIVEWR